jgi:hypothetical protein
MTQKQKDTIREEFEDKFCVMLERADRERYLAESAEQWTDKLMDYWLSKLDQAYQQGYDSGAKDKVEEVDKCVRECAGAYDFVPPPELTNLLKDNT